MKKQESMKVHKANHIRKKTTQVGVLVGLVPIESSGDTWQVAPIQWFFDTPLVQIRQVQPLFPRYLVLEAKLEY